MNFKTIALLGVSVCAAASNPVSSATVSGGFAGLYASAEGSSKTVDIAVPVPAAAEGASISFERDDTVSGAPPGGSGTGRVTLGSVSRTLVSVPTSISPQVDVSAEAIANRPPGSTRSGGVGAAAGAALAYEALIRQTASPAGLTFTSVPVTASVFTFLSVTSSGPTFDTSSGLDRSAFAQATTEVQISDRPITVGSRASLIAADPDRVDALFATVLSQDTESDLFDPGVSALALMLPVDTLIWVGKSAQVAVRASLPDASLAGDAGLDVTAFAEAVVDPVFVFDQARFQSEYGAQCLDAGLGACPLMDGLFEFEVSPGFGNGSAVIPLPPSLVLFLTALGGLARFMRRRRA